MVDDLKDAIVILCDWIDSPLKFVKEKKIEVDNNNVIVNINNKIKDGYSNLLPKNK